MTTNRFDVCVDWAGETPQVGTLYAHDRSAADHRLVAVDGRGVAVIRRFDRDGKRRIPFISASTLLGLRLAAARAIVGEVQAAIRRWRSIATRAGIADATLGAYADCFGSP